MRLFFIIYGALVGLVFGFIAIKEIINVVTQVFYKQEYLIHAGHLGVIFMASAAAIICVGIGIHALLNE